MKYGSAGSRWFVFSSDAPDVDSFDPQLFSPGRLIVFSSELRAQDSGGIGLQTATTGTISLHTLITTAAPARVADDEMH